jgi:hypothetical protein
MAKIPHWTEVLTLRHEVTASDGGVGELQMSLHKAVYQTVNVPYRDVAYYSDITQPTPNLIGFFSRIARRLGGAGEATALYHLDQGMGGGKSHALVGLYHMASDPKAFFATALGKSVLDEAQANGTRVDLARTRVVTLTADNFSPGKTSETFGPATDLFGRFLWLLFAKNRAQYDKYLAMGANKQTIRSALLEVGDPVLVLLDELMDYVMDLSDARHVDTMPGEKAFLNALADACDDVERVAFVVVMIRSELDQEGYTPLAEDFRTYIAKRLERNGTKQAVTETGDFAAIIRRRLFEQTTAKLPAAKLAKAYQEAIASDPAWGSQVFDRLGPGKSAANLPDRIADSYPFHPDLMDLVQNEWATTQGFQRVRSTVAIFALTALHWARTAQAGDWAPALIGVGDLPLGGIRGAGKTPQARCLDALLNSGLLLGNDRAIQGYRAVATTDITSADGSSGRAVEVDEYLRTQKIATGQPNPAVRMATALFNYSLVGRAQGRRGATKAELVASLLIPAGGATSSFANVEQVFIQLTGEEGLGALEVARPGNAAERYWLTIKQTLRMFFSSAKNRIVEPAQSELLWETAQSLATRGPFDELRPIAQPVGTQTLADVTAGVDSQCTRLLVLDPRRWTLLNGEDGSSRGEIRSILGVGEKPLIVDNAASCVVAAVNTYQRRYALQAAHDVLTWRLVASQVTDDDERADVRRKLTEAESKLKEKTRAAYRHFAYLTRNGDHLDVVHAKLEEEKQSSLNGTDVWSALVTAKRAVGEHFDPTEKRRKRVSLSERYVALLLKEFDRHLTLKDVASSFFKDPRFPLVPTIDEIRQVIFDLLQPAGHAGPGTGGWELVGADQTVLHAASPQQLAINSIAQQLRPAQPRTTTGQGPVGQSPGAVGGTDTEDHRIPASGEGDGGESTPATDGATPAAGKTDDSFSWYRFELVNRSITDEALREAVRTHLIWLASRLDDAALDHQLLTLRYELLARTSEALEQDLRNRGASLQANKVEIDSED